MSSVRVQDVHFRYQVERFELVVRALQLDAAEPTAIIGPSGCGKTTLLRLVAGILRPSRGSITVLDRDLTAMSEAERRAFRIARLGLVFQEFELLDYLTVADNVLLPYRVSSALRLDAAARRTADELAEATGITHLLAAHPHELSHGERQRVAICRALVTRPALILADEPTGSLDPANQDRVVALLRERAEASGAGLVMVTHDHELLPHFARTIELPSVLGVGADPVEAAP